MNEEIQKLLALTLEIPDWLFDGRFWGGFFTAAVFAVLLFLYAVSNFNPWGR